MSAVINGRPLFGMRPGRQVHRARSTALSARPPPSAIDLYLGRTAKLRAKFSTKPFLQPPSAEFGSGGDGSLTDYLRLEIKDLKDRLAAASTESRELLVSAAVETEKLRSDLTVARLQNTHELKDLREAKDRRISELEERQAADGIAFLLKSRMVSARGAMEWAEREIRRLRFPGEEVERQQLWKYVVGKNEKFRECLTELEWTPAEAPGKLRTLYGKVSEHIHDRQSPEATTVSPIIILREDSGEGFLTTAEAGSIRCICRIFRLSYDAYSRDQKSGEVSSKPETFRALSDDVINKQCLEFYRSTIEGV